MPFRIVAIVEGHGEYQAVPVLFRRLVTEMNPELTIGRPVRQSRGSLLKSDGIERAVQLAVIEAGTDGAVVVLIDSEGDCPAELAPALLARARSARNDIRIAVILAHQEFEAWFLASASSLRGLRRLSQDIDDHPDPEGVRGCKEWLEARMPPNSKYSETADQPAFAAAFDLTLARQAPSFDKLYRELERICREARGTLEAR
jgi:hypothetical protein